MKSHVKDASMARQWLVNGTSMTRQAQENVCRQGCRGECSALLLHRMNSIQVSVKDN